MTEARMNYIALILLAHPDGHYVYPGWSIDLSFRAPEQVERLVASGAVAEAPAGSAETIFEGMRPFEAQALVDLGISSLKQFAESGTLALSARFPASYQQLEAWQQQAKDFLAAMAQPGAAPAAESVAAEAGVQPAAEAESTPATTSMTEA